MKTRAICFVLLLFALTPWVSSAQEVIRPDTENASLQARWSWAAEQAKARRTGAYWIGYTIEHTMSEYSSISSWSKEESRTSLHELIYGTRPVATPSRKRNANPDQPERMVKKTVALLFAFKPDTPWPTDLRVTNIEGPVDLKNRPIFWLGAATDGESMDLTQRLFRETRHQETRERLVMAISMHENKTRILSLLEDIVGSKTEEDEIRKSAVFWLGQQDDARALKILLRTALDDRSAKLQDHAIFSISQIKLPEATEALIELTRKGSKANRKKAIFWLGQQASECAVAALGELIDESGDTEVQKEAVFALSQLPDHKGIPMLIDIARTHPSAKVRKDAIFWLSQSEDPRALELLIELARG